jgi:hypothetical protein
VYPLSIPHLGGRDLAPGTKNSILDVLEEDVLAWEEKLGPKQDEETEGRENGDGNGPG